jgi:hypothetical protein
MPSPDYIIFDKPSLTGVGLCAQAKNNAGAWLDLFPDQDCDPAEEYVYIFF